MRYCLRIDMCYLAGIVSFGKNISCRRPVLHSLQVQNALSSRFFIQTFLVQLSGLIWNEHAVSSLLFQN